MAGYHPEVNPNQSTIGYGEHVYEPLHPDDYIGVPFDDMGFCQVDQLLARSSTAHVYAGTRMRDDLPVAIKAFGSSIDPSLIEREIELLQTYSSEENFINFIGVAEKEIEEDTITCVVTELVEGGSLQERIRSREIIDEEELATGIYVIRGVVRAIERLQSNGLVYRDLKPDNILINKKEEGKLADLGSVTRQRRNPYATSVIGTPGFIAPEAYEGTIDPASDVFGVGATLYKTLTGEYAYPTDAQLHSESLQRGDVPKAPAEINPRVPEVLSELVMSAINLEAAKRPSARALNNSLTDMQLALAA